MTINRTNPSTPSSAATTFSHSSLLASSPNSTAAEFSASSSQPPLPPASRPPLSSRATSTTLYPDSQSSSSFRPSVSRMRSRGRSITATDPSLLLSTSSPSHPSFLPSQSSASTTHHQSPSQRASPLPSVGLNPSIYPRSRAPTLSVLPSSTRQFESIEDEPDTPSRPRDADTWIKPKNPNQPTHGRGRSLSLGVQPLKNPPSSKRQSPANGPRSTTTSTAHKHGPPKRSKPWGESLFGFSNASVGNLGIGTNSRDQLWRYPEESDTEHSPTDRLESYHHQDGSDSSDIDSDEENASGSQDGSEASLRIRVQQHGSNLHLPLIPFNSLPRRPTLTFTSSSTTLLSNPPETDQNASSSHQTSYFYDDQNAFPPSLPTPALSSSSLSSYNFRPAHSRSSIDLVRNGDSLNEVTTTVSTARRVTTRELRQLAKGMIPTLIAIAIAFLCSFGIVIGLLRGLPIPPSFEGRIPKSSADIQLVSSAINRYMEHSTSGYLHTMLALGLAGVWTHAWSVPGSVVLNVLLGALLPAVPAVFFLTCSTTLGGFCSYLLSRPLSPLITLLFPTQLAVVRASIASPGLSTNAGGSKQTGFGSGPWRKLFVMRATGLVPWSGMNVACGVVGVRWDVFCGTFAAGSLSWNYVTSQVGALLMQISQPTNPSSDPQDPAPSESITSLLRDPSIIIKLVALSLLSLVPVLLKPKTTVTVQDGRGPPIETSASAGWWALPLLTRMGRGRGAAGMLGILQRSIGSIGAMASKWMGVDWMRGMEEGSTNSGHIREGLMSGTR
ncbi:Predicted membrane protein [Phaffia rhodozyma]|uniref:Predicted membrane protein n=1 Tax=Phaffia rhodozyma TaxID=264483 RepID=A0A0F7SMK0_PHARH|nr:Predicted membrane protein [Phaffia rhodozyma]